MHKSSPHWLINTIPTHTARAHRHRAYTLAFTAFSITTITSIRIHGSGTYTYLTHQLSHTPSRPSLRYHCIAVAQAAAVREELAALQAQLRAVESEAAAAKDDAHHQITQADILAAAATTRENAAAVALQVEEAEGMGVTAWS